MRPSLCGAVLLASLASAPASRAQAPKPPAPKPPGPKAPADPEEGKIREVLKKQQAYGAAGTRIRQIKLEYAKAKLWVQQAILLVELSDTKDRRAVSPLAKALKERNKQVVAFALHGLRTFSQEDLRHGGGVALGEGLVKALKIRSGYHRKVARQVLIKLVGSDLGRKPTKWKAWLRKNPELLALKDARAPVFRPGDYKKATVKRVLTGLGPAGTSLRKRIPPVSVELRSLTKNGIDIVLVLDETKKNIDVLVGVVRYVVPRARVGLVTYNDKVVRNLGLKTPFPKLKETLDSVRANGGGDMPEGVDKGLSAALNPRFGWRRKSAKTIVVLGDAPPHPEDVDSTLTRVKQAFSQAKIRTNTVSTGFRKVPELEKIAAAGGGKSLVLKQKDKLVSEVLLLIFGESLRPAMERFVPVLLEVLQGQRDAGKRR